MQDLKEFRIEGDLIDLQSLERGHIHDTYIGVWQKPTGTKRYLHQKINQFVFKDPDALMANIKLVLNQIERIDPNLPRLSVINTHSGSNLLKTKDAQSWRTFEFIENTTSYDLCPSDLIAYQAGKVAGRFLQTLSGLNPSNLVDSIPRFHDTAWRYSNLHLAISGADSERLIKAKEIINLLLAEEKIACCMIEAFNAGTLPKRVTHNDLKLNNILFDNSDPHKAYLVDLDTCMAGTVLYDYGDLIRSVCLNTVEDQLDLAKLEINLNYLNSSTRGYLEGVGGSLTLSEKMLMPQAPRIMALTLAVRFLTDYLENDRYFKVQSTEHNLQRAKVQLEVANKFGRLEEAISKLM